MANNDDFDNKFNRQPSSIFENAERVGAPSQNPIDVTGFDNKHNRGASQAGGINWGEVLGDVAQTPLDLASSLYQGVANAPETLPDLYNELDAGTKQPTGRKLKNLLAGLGNFGDTLNQAPANARDYFIRKGAPEDFMSFIGRPEKNNWQEFLGLGDVQPGDKGFQGLGSAATGAILSGGTGLGASIVGGLHEAGENRNPLVPGAGVGALKLGQSLYRGLTSARGSNLAPEVAEANIVAEQTNRANYQRFNQQTQAAGVNQNFNGPRDFGRIDRTTNQNRILNDVPDGYTESFRNYVNHGRNFEDALPAISDLRGYAHGIRNLGLQATPEQLKNMRAAFEAADRMETSVNRAFERSGHPALREELQMIKDFHANEVIPFRAQRRSFDLHGRNRISHENLIDDLMGNREFMHMLSDRFPGFRNRGRAEMTKTIGKYLGIPSAIGTGGYAAYNFLTGQNE